MAKRRTSSSSKQKGRRKPADKKPPVTKPEASPPPAAGAFDPNAESAAAATTVATPNPTPPEQLPPAQLPLRPLPPPATVADLDRREGVGIALTLAPEDDGYAPTSFPGVKGLTNKQARTLKRLLIAARAEGLRYQSRQARTDEGLPVDKEQDVVKFILDQIGDAS